MVFFTCNGCGESLKKAQVDKHLGNCRNCQCLSCIDCGKDFWGSDYKTHLKCVTEDEKYGGKGFEAKAKKGEEKQAQWIQRIQEASKKPTISNDVRSIISQISAFDNVPKKKAKFQNWMKNSLKVSSPALQDKVWEIFEEAISNKNTNNNTTETENEGKSQSSAATEEGEKKSKRERKEERQKKNKKEKKDLNAEEQVQNGTKKTGKKRKMEEEEDEEAKDQGTKGKKKKKRNQEDDDASGDVEEEPQSKKRNNSEGEEEAEENGDEDSGKSGKFNWKGTIKALLRQAPDNELPIKKLRKKVIAQYYTISSEHHKTEENLLATFNKKIQNNPKFRVLKERVKLVK